MMRARTCQCTLVFGQIGERVFLPTESTQGRGAKRVCGPGVVSAGACPWLCQSSYYFGFVLGTFPLIGVGRERM